MDYQSLSNSAIELLKQLISTQSFSGEESKVADLMNHYLTSRGIKTQRHMNNVWAVNEDFDAAKPTVLLNSHLDTVRPNTGYTRNPFEPTVEGDKLYGLGSNDAGGCLVSLAAAFTHFYHQKGMKYNIAFAATAEEENSGKNGLECVLPLLPPIDFAIVGEPTQMQLAVAEKGLMVLDCVAHGKSGHAARNEGVNAIFKAIEDIEWLNTYRFPVVSNYLGEVKMSVTMISAGTQHNVVPDRCSFVVDVRLTDAYTLEEVFEFIKQNIKSDVTCRSMRLRPSKIEVTHPIVQAGLALGRTTYGSPTTSDQALVDSPSLKLGPGDSARSHTADEYVHLSEIHEGVELYIKMLEKVIL